MKTDKFGQVILTSDDIFRGLYSGKIKDLTAVRIDSQDDADKFNASSKTNYNRFELLHQYIEPDLALADFDTLNQSIWFMPDEYKVMDIEGYLVHICPKQNYQRLIEELELYRQYNMIDLLRYLKYLVDTMREHNIVWGVGRGSSVASYCLYLLGVHKVDSIKYKLDIKEFLK
jgi:DNA polymerase III alpha subunit